MQSSSNAPPEHRSPNHVDKLNGDELRRAFLAATQCLETYRDAVNALNVFPVPDGDTGTNMLLTMRSVNQYAEECSETTADAIAAAMARGALMNSRGNSGVILSQFFHGLSQGLSSKDTFDGNDLAQAFESASKAANSAVSKPVPGTMLTVISEASIAVSKHVAGDERTEDVRSAWCVALEAAKDALCKTPLQLAVLRDAGVVDAGGQGFAILLEGACKHICDEPIDHNESWLSIPVLDGDAPISDGGAGSPFDPSAPSVSQEYLQATQDDLYGYCTQFLLSGEQIDVDQIRIQLAEMADSTVVVGAESIAKVHLHTHDPGPVISFAVTLGVISQVSMENIDQQHQEFIVLHSAGTTEGGAAGQASPQSSLAVVAVAPGDGFVSLFQELGCAAVVPGGQTMNPSTGELLEAARNTGADQVVVLPNNSNIVAAARQAAGLSEGRPVINVLPSRTLPQGVAAMLSFNPENVIERNLEEMESALGEVRTLEVTQAVRDATIGGVSVQEGQFIALLEGALTGTGDSPLATLSAAVASILETDGSSSPELLTLYWGGDISEEGASEAAEELGRQHPNLQIQAVYGGQPHYSYIVSIE